MSEANTWSSPPPRVPTCLITMTFRPSTQDLRGLDRVPERSTDDVASALVGPVTVSVEVALATAVTAQSCCTVACCASPAYEAWKVASVRPTPTFAL